MVGPAISLLAPLALAAVVQAISGHRNPTLTVELLLTAALVQTAASSYTPPVASPCPSCSRHRKLLAYQGVWNVWSGLGEAAASAVLTFLITEHQPSRRVMTKLGMRHVRTDHRQWDDPLPGSEQGEVVYEVSHGEWTSAR